MGAAPGPGDLALGDETGPATADAVGAALAGAADGPPVQGPAPPSRPTATIGSRAGGWLRRLMVVWVLWAAAVAVVSALALRRLRRWKRQRGRRRLQARMERLRGRLARLGD